MELKKLGRVGKCGVWSLEFGVWKMFWVGRGFGLEEVWRFQELQDFRVSEFLLKMERVEIGMNCRDAIYRV